MPADGKSSRRRRGGIIDYLSISLLTYLFVDSNLQEALEFVLDVLDLLRLVDGEIVKKCLNILRKQDEIG